MSAKKTILRLLTGILVALVVVGGSIAYRIYYDRKVPNFTGEMDLYVYPGMDADHVCDSILSSGATRSQAIMFYTATHRRAQA